MATGNTPTVRIVLEGGILLYAGGAAASFFFNSRDALGVGVGGLLVVAGVGGVLRPGWATLLPLAAWALGSALVRTLTAGGIHETLAIASQGARWLMPVALAWLVTGHVPMARQALRWGSALTFAGHGLQAIGMQPKFIDYLVDADVKIFRAGLSIEGAGWCLQVIGTIDLALAVLILTTNWRLVPLYMALWGILTAAARVMYGGLDAWPEAAIRIPHAAAPVAVFFLLKWGRSRVATGTGKIGHV